MMSALATEVAASKVTVNMAFLITILTPVIKSGRWFFVENSLQPVDGLAPTEHL
jgi:hypothetical protein